MRGGQHYIERPLGARDHLFRSKCGIVRADAHQQAAEVAETHNLPFAACFRVLNFSRSFTSADRSPGCTSLGAFPDDLVRSRPPRAQSRPDPHSRSARQRPERTCPPQIGPTSARFSVYPYPCRPQGEQRSPRARRSFDLLCDVLRPCSDRLLLRVLQRLTNLREISPAPSA